MLIRLLLVPLLLATAACEAASIERGEDPSGQPTTAQPAVTQFRSSLDDLSESAQLRQLSLPELPRLTVNTEFPAVTGRSVAVRAGDDLQAAINAAQPGDELVLQAGATFTGPFKLPRKAGDGWIVIRSGGMLPSAGTRVTPAAAPQMARLVSRFPAEPVIFTAPGAHHYRLVGLEVTANPDATLAYTLVALGDGSPEQNTLDEIPHHLVLDRVYVHGTPALNFQRCIGLNSSATAVVDSWISECHGKGFDSQAIGGWNGPGPYKIVNNHLAGAGENVMFGGADPQIPNLLPRDIEFRRNHVYKPAEWEGVWSVKNSFELKIGQRILVEANVFEHSWLDAQIGFAIVIKSTNQNGGAPWSQTSDVTFRYNVVRNSAHGVSLAGAPEMHPAVPAARLVFSHNVFEQIGSGSYPGGRMWQVSDIRGLTLDHNTGIGASHGLIFAGAPVSDLVMTHNILGAGLFTITSDAGRGTAALTKFAPGAQVRGNVFIGVSRSDPYPADNHYPATITDVGFINYAGGDLRLSSSSSFVSPLAGADVGAVHGAVAGVVVP